MSTKLFRGVFTNDLRVHGEASLSPSVGIRAVSTKNMRHAVITRLC